MKNKITMFISIMSILLICSCTKTTDDAVNNQLMNKTTATNVPSSKDKDQQATTANHKNTNPTNTQAILNLSSPVRDINTYGNNTGTSFASFACGTQDYHCCNGICLSTPTGAPVSETSRGCSWSCIIQTDAFSNKIDNQASYGTDPRQIYYVNLPPNINVNSPIVVLIHGGGWSGGPDPDQVKGYPSTFSDNSTDNLVNDLLNNGFVVVSPLYRLMQYGDNNSEIVANNISWQDQIDDIDAAITHVHNNFPNCIYGHPLNANSIQVMGESAGGHLALMWAYTKANTSYIKSVISMYAPTNMNQFADFANNKPLQFTCNNNSNYILLNPNSSTPPPASHFPYYTTVDIDPNQTSVFASVSSPTCTLSKINNVSGTYTTLRVLDGYKLLESGVKTVVTNPLTNSLFTAYSPKDALNADRIIPTFIMHGTDDWLIPYKFATDGMQAKLTATGGLISLLNTSQPFNSTVPDTYTGFASKHLIKLYQGANHTFFGFSKQVIRQDVLKWFNGHK